MNDEVTGKAKGGKARAASMSPEKRREIAMMGVEAKKERAQMPRATHAGVINIGGNEIRCFVLDDGRRVLSGRSLTSAIGMKGRGQGVARISTNKLIKSSHNRDLYLAIENPIKFVGKSPKGRDEPSDGFEATVLQDICEAILTARDNGNATTDHDRRYVQQADILIRGFARVGIIALVDEATGYQADRAKDALSRILEVFIAKELQPYLPTFPTDFYKELFRLRGLNFAESTVKRPQYFGVLTNDIVYKRLAPGVLEELKKVSEKRADGSLKHKLFQRLTSNKGYPTLRGRLDAIVAIMKLSKNYSDFIDKMNVVFPKYGQLSLALEYDQKDDSGEGI